MSSERFDVAVIGSGPAGQQAALYAASSGRSVCVIEKELSVGGSCVTHGTIPSKTLREVAASFDAFRRRVGDALTPEIPADTRLEALLQRKQQVIREHQTSMVRQLRKSKVSTIAGRARFVAAKTLEVLSVRGERRMVDADIIVIACGSRPRRPDTVPIDHEHVLDSDSILSMLWLPKSLVVLGGGVIGCEYATVFAALGVEVTIVDRAPRPLAFLDPELSHAFSGTFEHRTGCHYMGGATVEEVQWNGVDAVETTLGNGWKIQSEKLLCAMGRVPNLDSLNLAAAGLTTSERGHVKVNERCETEVEGIFAIGDAIGFPSLASAALEQGRRAMRCAAGQEPGDSARTLPMGIYTIPEISSVGLSEVQADEEFGSCLVGRTSFQSVARGQISGAREGFLKLVAAPDGRRLLGVHVFGEGATELVHIGEMALLQNAEVDLFVEQIFNFPTMAEAYREAAMEIVTARERSAEDRSNELPTGSP